jgi:hypothetical protein
MSPITLPWIVDECTIHCGRSPTDMVKVEIRGDVKVVFAGWTRSFSFKTFLKLNIMCIFCCNGFHPVILKSTL